MRRCLSIECPLGFSFGVSGPLYFVVLAFSVSRNYTSLSLSRQTKFGIDSMSARGGIRQVRDVQSSPSPLTPASRPNPFDSKFHFHGNLDKFDESGIPTIFILNIHPFLFILYFFSTSQFYYLLMCVKLQDG